MSLTLHPASQHDFELYKCQDDNGMIMLAEEDGDFYGSKCRLSSHRARCTMVNMAS